MVSRVMRLSPGAAIKEHYHPNFDETFFVHAGTLKLRLDDKEHEVRAGDMVIMPAGTIISGTSTGSDEAVLSLTPVESGDKQLSAEGRQLDAPDHRAGIGVADNSKDDAPDAERSGAIRRRPCLRLPVD